MLKTHPILHATVLSLLLIGCGEAAQQAPARVPDAQDATPGEARSHAALVLAFGDSLYAGYGLREDEGLAPQLERQLEVRGVSATVLNASVSGSPSAAGRARLPKTLDGLDRRPDLVLVGFGSVDMLQGVPPAEMRGNLAAILDELRERGIPALLTGMRNGPGFGDESWQPYGAVYHDLSAEYGVPLYPFLLEGVAGDPALVLSDRIHPSAAGAEHIAENIAAEVAGALPEQAGTSVN